ncbi:MAG: XRE family transcriptional regulator [Verrucomicrobiaceae bacterium]|nr:MAG: XRE family transcriptional regulator [Verrucomicrobiaceae bacterium]
MEARYQGLYAEVGRRVRNAREAADLTQEDLARRASLKRTTVTNIEKGRQGVLLHTLVELAQALEVKPDELMPNSVPHASADAVLQVIEDDQAREWVLSTLSSKRTAR